ncbi:MAG TPA: hypothetical protein VOA78_15370 [Candidatus Dormibacteraeota bacterium]|nr:hypothetical protein [Candidatus Dormibacteraeota bacterium]
MVTTEFNLSWILPYVRESLRGRGNLSFDGFADGVFAVLEKVGVGKGIEKRPQGTGYTGHTFNFDAAHPDIRFAVTEAFYYLEQNRFILRPPPTNASAFVSGGQCQITRRGQEWANSVEPLPEDYDGYMSQFGASTDAVVRQYVSEALNTYIRGTYFASAVMIGAASEKTIYLLAESLVLALKDGPAQSLLQRKIDARRLEALLKGVEQIVVDGNLHKVIPFDVMGGTTRHLLSLFDSIRLQRNDAIHPMNFVVSASSVRFTLNAFPLAFEKVEALRQWCIAHPASL